MLRAASLIAVSLAFLFLSACGGAPVTPSAVASSSGASMMAGAVTARLQPGTIPLTPVAGSGCPLVPPFTSSFDLLIQSQAAAAMSVDSVTFRFLDGSSVSSRPITFPNGTLVPSAASVTLPFAPQFGCGIGRPQWVVADVAMRDTRGALQTVTVRAATQ